MQGAFLFGRRCFIKWFQHDTDASTDAKLKKLTLRHGTDGYAIYFHCLELIAGDITKTNINFELEHDSEIIADNLKVKGTADESAIDKVNRIMKSIIELGLFTESNNRVFCFKLAQRLDNTISRSPEINTIKELLRSSNVVDTKMLQSPNAPEKNKSDKNKSNESKSNKNKSKQIKEGFDFEKVWELYPKKLGKDKALDKFNVQVITKEDYDNIIIAVNKFVKYHIDKKTDELYIPYGSTWFNKSWKSWIMYEPKKQESNPMDKINYNNIEEM